VLTCSATLACIVGADVAAMASQESEQKQVVAIYATRRDSQISMVGDRNLPRLLEEGLGDDLDYHAEYLDLSRFPGKEYRAAVKDFLRRKYDGIHVDVVIAMTDVVVQFLAENREDLFEDSPIVYFANWPTTTRVANSTGIVGTPTFGGTVRLATALQPALRRMYVVVGSEPVDQQLDAIAQQQLAEYGGHLQIEYLRALPTDELERRLASLPPDSAVYYVLVTRDGAGRNFNALAYAERVAAAANAPVYSWVDSTMDRGIVGGSLKSQTKQVDALGNLALRVLNGERADSIPVSSPDLNVIQVDWRQLRRWGISESRVPPGTLVQFKEPSAWDRYKLPIIGGIVVLLAETGLIAGLLLQMTMRRRAEARERESQVELHASYDRIRDLGSRLLSAQDTERARIARELHDDISQQLALLAIDLELLGRGRGSDTPALTAQARDRTAAISKSVHDLSHQLYPTKLRLVGLVGALNGLQREVSRSGMMVTLTHDDVPAALPLDVTLCVFRVVQEALQNAARHGHAEAVSIRLTGGPNLLNLTVSDDGEGFDVAAAWNRGVGLHSMRERIQACGGTIDIQSTAGAGTRLQVQVPLAGARTSEQVAG
jgi:signal transduction histidine kinase